MALKEQIQSDMKAALLGGNRFEGDVLRNLKAVILNEEVALGKRDEGLTDAEVESLIAKEVKKRKESISLYEQNNRTDLAKSEQDEVDILNRYLPEQMTEAEIRQLAKDVADKIGADSMKHMGQVISGVKKQVGTAADGAVVARVVKDLLSN